MILQLLIGAGILIVLLNVICGDEVEMIPAVIIAFCTLVGWSIIHFLLLSLLPAIAALIVSAAIVTVGLGAALSLILGTPLKSSCIVALAFLGCHLAISIGIGLLFRAAAGNLQRCCVGCLSQAPR